MSKNFKKLSQVEKLFGRGMKGDSIHMLEFLCYKGELGNILQFKDNGN